MRLVSAATIIVLALVPPSSAGDPATDKAAAYARAGAAALDAKDFDRAVTYFDKAVEAAPGQAALGEMLAKAVRERGLSHAKSEVLVAAGRDALIAGAYDKAIGYFDKALDEWPQHPRARAELTGAISRQREANRNNALGLARMYASRGQWDDAQKQYLAALVVDPNNTDVRAEMEKLVARRPLQGARAWIKAASDLLADVVGSWVLLAVGVVLVVAMNVMYRWRSSTSIEVLPFEGPDAAFKQGPGYGMAAIASSQLHAAGVELGHGAVIEPLSQLSAKLTDPQARLLGDFIAWLFPPQGYRLEAVVHQFSESPVPARIGVTVKLVRLRFWLPRERIAATTTFWRVTQGPVHETLARLAAGWAEWHVIRR
jgi:hypothetical protein